MKTIRYILILASVLSLHLAVQAAQKTFTISGYVRGADDRKPLAAVTVSVDGTPNWAITNTDGYFEMQHVHPGETVLVAQLLGYTDATFKLQVSGPVTDIDIRMYQATLKIDDVVVTARQATSEMSSAQLIGKSAIEHLQMNSLSDIATLLPGASTQNPDLTTESIISLRSGGSTAGNASFGTAVEVDGVRLSTNASFSSASGAGTRSVSTANVESVEVITGVASAEYGDVGSGIVKVHTAKGRTPWKISLSTNPRTKIGSVSKGFSLGEGKGTINTSIEYAYATKDLMSPYESYTRRVLTLGYNNIWRKVWKFNVGVTANIGGMNSRKDPDALKEERTRQRDNAVRLNSSLEWLLNKSWISNVVFETTLNYSDQMLTHREPVDNGSMQPAAHTQQEGYYFVDMLPTQFLRTGYVDSKELDFTAKLRAVWNRKWGDLKSNLKVGVAFQTNGNLGRGEYYDNPLLSPHGFRPQDYSEYPFMHNLALFVEEKIEIPLSGKDYRLEVMAGLRGEKTFISGSDYKNTQTLSPRLNAKLRLGRSVTLRGGWGLAEKLPAFNILYPRQEYRDIQVFAASYGSQSAYAFYSQPFMMTQNPKLRWQRNRNAEVGVDISAGGFSLSLSAFSNKTRYPFKVTTEYVPFSYSVSEIPSGFVMPENPQFRIDPVTGVVSVGNAGGTQWTQMQEKVRNETFVTNRMQDNGSSVIRRGVEFMLDFPEINALRTQFRLDGSYVYTKYLNSDLMWYYPQGQSSTVDKNKSYQYAGVYVNTGSTSATYNGRRSSLFSLNATSITHIPAIRMVVTLRLEATLVRRMQNLSSYQGHEYAKAVDGNGVPTGESVYSADSYTAIYPLYYVDASGQMLPFTDAEASNPDFRNLILRSGNIYQYKADGYDPYFSANLSVTKEFGDHVSISLYANNFTNSRKAVASYATGVKAIFTPEFYYGLSLRLKF